MSRPSGSLLRRDADADRELQDSEDHEREQEGRRRGATANTTDELTDDHSETGIALHRRWRRREVPPHATDPVDGDGHRRGSSILILSKKMIEEDDDYAGDQANDDRTHCGHDISVGGNNRRDRARMPLSAIGKDRAFFRKNPRQRPIAASAPAQAARAVVVKGTRPSGPGAAGKSHRTTV